MSDNIMQKSPTLQSSYTLGNFALKEIDESDLEVTRVWRNSEHVKKWTFTEDKITPEAQLKWFYSRRNRSDFIFYKEEKKLGFACLFEKSEVHKNCKIGFYVGEKKHLGSGFGAIIEFMALDLAFMKWQYNKVWGFALPEHKKVLGMHKKFGFQEEGYLKSHLIKSGHYIDVIVVGLLRKEWLEHRDRYMETLKSLLKS